MLWIFRNILTTLPYMKLLNIAKQIPFSATKYIFNVNNKICYFDQINDLISK